MSRALFHHSRCPRCLLGVVQLVEYEAKGNLRVYLCSLSRCGRRFQVASGQLVEVPKGRPS